MDILLILLMLGFVGFFAASEIAFVTASRLRVEVEARRGGLAGQVVMRFLRDPATFLTTTLVGTNLALVLYSTLVAFYLDPPLERLFGVQLGLSTGTADVLVLVTQTIIASTIVLVFGEIIPKSIARETANRAVFVLGLPLRVFYWLLWVLVKLAGSTSAMLARLFRSDAEDFAQFIRRDFEILLQEHRDIEVNPGADDDDVLANVLTLGGLRVRELMVPRPDVEAVEKNASLDEVRERFIESGHSRLPVYDESVDRIVGIAFAFDLFGNPPTLADMLRPAHFVPEQKGVQDLLREMLALNHSLAIVVDEYGGTAGLVTREDLLERLFGDIQDEFDMEDDYVRQAGPDVLIAAGRTDLDLLADRYDVSLSDGNYETLAGYLLDRIGEVPPPKSAFDFDAWRFTILDATANRINLVRIEKVELPAPEVPEIDATAID